MGVFKVDPFMKARLDVNQLILNGEALNGDKVKYVLREHTSTLFIGSYERPLLEASVFMLEKNYTKRITQ